MRKETIKINKNNALHFLIIPASEQACKKHSQRKKVPAPKGTDPQEDPGVHAALKAQGLEYFTDFEILYINVSGKTTKRRKKKKKGKKPTTKHHPKYWGFSLVMTAGLYFQKSVLWLNIRPVA